MSHQLMNLYGQIGRTMGSPLYMAVGCGQLFVLEVIDKYGFVLKWLIVLDNHNMWWLTKMRFLFWIGQLSLRYHNKYVIHCALRVIPRKSMLNVGFWMSSLTEWKMLSEFWPFLHPLIYISKEGTFIRHSSKVILNI